MRRFTMIAVAALSLAACGGDDEPAPASCAELGEGAACGEGGTCRAGACVRTVTGRWDVHRYVEAGKVAEPPPDLTRATIEAIVETSSGFLVREGTGHADGTFEIPDVPVGRYWLHTLGGPRPEYFEERTESEVSVSSGRVGRSASAFATGRWDVGGLEPDASSALEVVCANGGEREGFMSVPAQATTASISPWMTAWASSAAGDRVWVVQVVDRDAGDYRYLAAVAAGELPAPFGPRGPELVPVAVTLAPLSPVTRVFDWRLSSFASVAASLAAEPSAYQWLTIGGRPWPDLALELPTRAHARAPIQAGGDVAATVSYGRAGPAGWVDAYSHETKAVVTLEGGGWRWSARVGVESWGLVSTSGTTRVAMTIGMPGNVALAPEPGANPGTVGRSPTLSWSPPAVGTAERYFVIVSPAAGGDPVYFRLAGTSLRFPPGALLEGTPHLAEIIASRVDGSGTAAYGLFVP